MDMSWKRLTQLLQATSPGPVSPPSPFSHHLLGLLQIACSGTRFPFQLNSLPLSTGPINARWLSLNRRSNQGLMRLISRNLGRFVFSNKPSFLGFFLRVSLTRHFVARSLDHPKPSPMAFLASATSFLPARSPRPMPDADHRTYIIINHVTWGHEIILCVCSVM